LYPRRFSPFERRESTHLLPAYLPVDSFPRKHIPIGSRVAFPGFDQGGIVHRVRGVPALAPSQTSFTPPRTFPFRSFFLLRFPRSVDSVRFLGIKRRDSPIKTLGNTRMLLRLSNHLSPPTSFRRLSLPSRSSV